MTQPVHFLDGKESPTQQDILSFFRLLTVSLHILILFSLSDHLLLCSTLNLAWPVFISFFFFFALVMIFFLFFLFFFAPELLNFSTLLRYLLIFVLWSIQQPHRLTSLTLTITTIITISTKKISPAHPRITSLYRHPHLLSLPPPTAPTPFPLPSPVALCNHSRVKASIYHNPSFSARSHLITWDSVRAMAQIRSLESNREHWPKLDHLRATESIGPDHLRFGESKVSAIFVFITITVWLRF